jgi:hypothetical protein
MIRAAYNLMMSAQVRLPAFPIGAVLAVCAGAVLPFTSASWGADPVPEPNSVRAPTSVPDSGFWPTPRMTELILMKGVRAISDRYELDETQQAALRKDFLTRYPDLLKRNRAALQTMTNEIFEMQLAGEQPDVDKAAEWGRQLEPVLADARKTMRGTYDAMRPLLSPEQGRRWEADFAQVWLGLGLVDAQLNRWKQGMFKPGDWPPAFLRSSSAAARPATTGPANPEGEESEPPAIVSVVGPMSWLAGDRRQGGAGQAGKPGASDRAGVSLDQWEGYVKQFIRRHDLDKAQTNQAMAILKDVRQRARQYRDQNRREFDRLEQEFRRSGAERRESIGAQLEALREPLARLFDELRDRLDGVLRSDQR